MKSKIACQKAIFFRYVLHCLGARVERPTISFGGNQGMPQISAFIDSECKKKH